MRRECQFCHRGHDVPGKEGVSHGICAKCLLCMQFESEAHRARVQVTDLLHDHPDLVEELTQAIRNELQNKIVWEGEYTLDVDPDVENVYKNYERKIRMDLMSEAREKNRR